MIKEYNVVLRNELVMVVAYDKKEIQFPTDNRKDKTVFVKFDKGKYSITDKKSYDSEIIKSQKRKQKEVIKEENSEL